MAFTAMRALARMLLFCLLAVAGVMPAGAAAGDPPDVSRIEPLKLSLDQAEAALKREDIGSAELAELRRSVGTARDALQALVDALVPQVAEADARLKQLGPAPAKDAPPEAPALAEERDTLTKAFGRLDGSAKQAKVLILRADQMVERITERRRVQYASRLFERSASVLAPSLWMEAAAAVPDEMRRLTGLMRQWAEVVGGKSWIIVAAAWFGVFVVVGGAWLLSRWLQRRHANRYAARQAARDAGQPLSGERFRRARAAMWVFLSRALLTGLAAMLVAAGLNALGLLSPPQVGEIALGLVIGFSVAALGHGVADALAAPEAPERRLIRLDDDAAGQLHTFVVWSARALGTAIALQGIHKTLLAPLSLTIATTMLFGMAIAILLVRLARSWPRADEQEAEKAATVARRFGWVRPLAWLLACVIGAALVAGYAGFAAFIALRVLAAIAILGIFYLLLMMIEAVFGEALDPESPRGRSFASALGLPVRNIRIVGTLMVALARVVLLVCALALIIGPWEASTADMFASLQTVQLGFQIGEIRISLRTVLAGVTVLVVVLLVTRVVQGWLVRRLLPLTAIEPSLQQSIATMFGYAGAIAAITFMLGAIGIDLQKIAFVAGALSVGIGFGLQSIVSNFVSGLILLAERPIRVGDSIVVGGEEGWVRRIRVRATEIETFERASVIVPNSQLITGLVKNWTHVNTQGRIIIKASVGYDADADAVKDLLQTTAAAHPQVMKTPPPRAFLAAFGDNALNFELRCVIANVENGMAVKSDLHLAVLKSFRAAGIEISPPGQMPENRHREKPDAAPPGAAEAQPAT